ncbi:hypothetical protein C1645_732528 [Glomus cerebriforme]|uniref:WSC domain-containing protein n=1 Tax=Glomus cerebriforme TaxID=658196 RepID=A0A397TLH2_9GLOM|nr:hypothetical protein C1645_732528 [Glomus cerebriforme]
MSLIIKDVLRIIEFVDKEYWGINASHVGGLESRSQCFCGNFYDSVDRLLSSEDCSASCPGNNSQICGGVWALSICEVLPPSNKGLIIGLSVGLGTLIIVIMVGFLIYRKDKCGSTTPKDPISEFDLANLDH